MSPIFLPDNFAGKLHMQHWADTVDARHINPDVLEYIVHLIVRKCSLSDKYEEKHKGYVPLYSIDLKRVSAHYRRHLRYLHETGVIDINNSYSTMTGKTKAYRLRLHYKHQKIVARELTNRRLLRLSRAASSRETERMRKAQLQYPALVQSLYDLRIDREAAMIYIDRLERWARMIYSDSEQRHLRWRVNLMRIRVERIHYGDISYLVDDTGRRFHSNLTSLNKELRHFLTYKGQPLGGIDIRNSQPYLSLLLLESAFWNGRLIDRRSPSQQTRDRELERMDEESMEPQYRADRKRIGYNDVLPESSIGSEAISIQDSVATYRLSEAQQEGIIMFLNQAQQAESQSSRLYVKRVLTGLYEYLLDAIPQQLSQDKVLQDLYNGLENPLLDRSYIKVLAMIALYSHPSSQITESMFARRVFRHHFPAAYRLFTMVKKSDYTLLAVILQRIESTLVLDRIARQFQQRYRMPVYTIHDGLYTTIPYIGKLDNVAFDVLTSATELPPTLKQEVWAPEQVRDTIKEVVERMFRKVNQNSNRGKQRKKKKRTHVTSS